MTETLKEKAVDLVKNDHAQLEPGKKHIVHRLGGRHLIFRLNKGQGLWRFVPRPYVLISCIQGPLWVFYGIGQIWLTHKKAKNIKDWAVRVPRFLSPSLIQLVDRLEPDIERFVDYCNDKGFTATLVIEKKVIEIHWTRRKTEPAEAEQKNDQPEKTIDEMFNELAQRFVALQLIEPAEV